MAARRCDDRNRRGHSHLGAVVMKKQFVLAAALVGGSWSSMFAQANSCAIGLTQDACQKAVDVFQYVAPQLGTAITGRRSRASPAPDPLHIERKTPRSPCPPSTRRLASSKVCHSG